MPTPPSTRPKAASQTHSRFRRYRGVRTCARVVLAVFGQVFAGELRVMLSNNVDRGEENDERIKKGVTTRSTLWCRSLAGVVWRRTSGLPANVSSILILFSNMRISHWAPVRCSSDLPNCGFHWNRTQCCLPPVATRLDLWKLGGSVCPAVSPMKKGARTKDSILPRNAPTCRECGWLCIATLALRPPPVFCKS